MEKKPIAEPATMPRIRRPFDTTGSVIQDTAAAVVGYEKALAQGMSRSLDLYQ